MVCVLCWYQRWVTVFISPQLKLVFKWIIWSNLVLQQNNWKRKWVLKMEKLTRRLCFRWSKCLSVTACSDFQEMMTEEIISLSLPLHVNLATDWDHISILNSIWKVLVTQTFRVTRGVWFIPSPALQQIWGRTRSCTSGPPAKAHPSSPARSRAAGGHRGSPRHQVPAWGQGRDISWVHK